MSWSIAKTGRAAAVAGAVKADLERIRCVGLEQTIKGQVSDIIVTALGGYPPTYPVSVEASGSQYTPEGHTINHLSVSIKPIHGFVE